VDSFASRESDYPFQFSFTSASHLAPAGTLLVSVALMIARLTLWVCLRGSHKANFDCPMDVRALVDDLGGSVRHLSMKKGSALIWTEALAHGTLPWRSDNNRRAIVLRYSAPNLAGGGSPQWSGMRHPCFETHTRALTRLFR
jgi:hypothetical protein